MTTFPSAAAIVAGGQARRFAGRDKSRLVVEGRTIIARQLEVLQPMADPVFVVADRADRFADLGLCVYADRVAGAGTLGGIYTAVDASPRDYVLVVACDQPYLDRALLACLVERAQGRDGAWVRTERGPEPLLACYARASAGRLRDLLEAGERRAGAIGDRLELAVIGPDELARFGPADRLLANINTPDDYARVQYRPA